MIAISGLNKEDIISLCQIIGNKSKMSIPSL